jgi:hypothetical protein
MIIRYGFCGICCRRYLEFTKRSVGGSICLSCYSDIQKRKIAQSNPIVPKVIKEFVAGEYKIMEGENMVEGYCPKCKVKKIMVKPEKRVLQTAKGDKHQIKGTCPDCSCNMSTFVKGE